VFKITLGSFITTPEAWCHGLVSASNKEPQDRSLTPHLPLVGCGGISEEKGKTHGLG